MYTVTKTFEISGRTVTNTVTAPTPQAAIDLLAAMGAIEAIRCPATEPSEPTPAPEAPQPHGFPIHDWRDVYRACEQVAGKENGKLLGDLFYVLTGKRFA